jgi:hypothetical protein
MVLPSRPSVSGILCLSAFFLQHAQVELHHVPADQHIRVLHGDPGVELFNQLARRGAVFKREVDLLGRLLRLAQHVHLALAAAFQRDRIQLLVGAGFDIERHHLQRRPVLRGWLELAVVDGVRALRAAAFDLHAGGDEALHQVALGRADVGLEHLDAMLAQGALQRRQLLVARRVDADHRLPFKRLQFQLAQFDAGIGVDQRGDGVALPGLGKGHRGLRGQADFLRAVVGRQPEFELRPLGGIAPVAGQDESLLGCGHHGIIILYAHTGCPAKKIACPGLRHAIFQVWLKA